MTRQAARPLLLTFDAFGTLFAPKEPIEKQYCDVARSFGISLRENDVKSSFKEAFKSMSKKHPNYGQATGMKPKAWWSDVIAKTFSSLIPPTLSLPESLISSLYLRFSSHEGYKLYDDVPRLLRNLNDDAFTKHHWPVPRTMLGVISNSDPRVREILGSFGIYFSPSMYPSSGPSIGGSRNHATFSFATLSYETGHQKPSSSIYEKALEAGQEAIDQIALKSGDECDDIQQFSYVHIGDDVENDVLPTMNSGWDAILLDRSNNATETITTGKLKDGRFVTIIKNLDVLNKVLLQAFPKNES